MNANGRARRPERIAGVLNPVGVVTTVDMGTLDPIAVVAERDPAGGSTPGGSTGSSDGGDVPDRGVVS